MCPRQMSGDDYLYTWSVLHSLHPSRDKESGGVSPLEIFVRIFYTFGNNFAMENDFTKYFKKSSW